MSPLNCRTFHIDKMTVIIGFSHMYYVRVIFLPIPISYIYFSLNLTNNATFLLLLIKLSDKAVGTYKMFDIEQITVTQYLSHLHRTGCQYNFPLSNPVNRIHFHVVLRLSSREGSTSKVHSPNGVHACRNLCSNIGNASRTSYCRKSNNIKSYYFSIQCERLQLTVLRKKYVTRL